MRYPWFIIGVFGLVLALTPWNVFAMEVRPALIEWSLPPGGTLTKTIHVKNNESEAKTYYFQLQKFLPQGDQGQQTFLPLNDTEQLPSWTFLNEPSIRLAPGEGRSIPVTLRIPENTSPGGYYEAFFVSSVPAVNGVMPAGFRTGVLFFVTVEGEVTNRIHVSSFERLSREFVPFLSAAFRLRVENTGGIHVRPSGFLVVRNVFGNIVERIPVNTDGAYVLPGSSRMLSVTWGDQRKEADPKTFWQMVRRQWLDGRWGLYHLSPELLHAQGQISRTRVVILPWHLLSVVLSGLMVVWILLRRYRKYLLKSVSTKNV